MLAFQDMKLTFKITLIFLSILFALFCGEIFFRIFLPTDVMSKYEELRGSYSTAVKDSQQKTFVSRKFQPKRPHPYLGFVYNDALSDRVNSDGFRELAELPYLHGDDEFVIGVFGGSFASDFAETQEFKADSEETDFAERLRALDPKYFKDKKITVLNFGLASGRQPQQYIAISLFLSSLDMAIIIDGFNEAYRNRDLDFPVYYPDYAKYFFSKRHERREPWAKIYQLRKKQQTLTENILASSFLSSSQVIYQFWRAYDGYIEKRINAQARLERPSKEFPKGISKEEYSRQKANIWSKYARLQAHILKSEKVPYVHVTQPNQYMPGTKELTAEEKEKLWPIDVNLESMLQSYGMILNELKVLNNEGFKITDFTMLFKEHSETIYRDGCCHINRVGNDILENALATEAIKALR